MFNSILVLLFLVKKIVSFRLKLSVFNSYFFMILILSVLFYLFLNFVLSSKCVCRKISDGRVKETTKTEKYHQ